ncbi:acetyl-CoA carboxylase biotin carboxyl carrier protein [Crocinitomix catalasitica]|uniref:acetyl-CoA carboxylase biotin carboxyl carrier protein n=1 Tax=Crocinitomix catalasitica TaxID=184607 RepID=UPI0004895D30|nr:acetyl-CoA carboxylase biotin carboxyl carrier protein [Crocinitomix catalasitica]
MDIKEIQNLVKFVAKSGVNEVSIEQGDFKITIKTEAEKHEQQYIVQQPQQAAIQAPPVLNQVATPVVDQGAQTTAEADDNGNLITIKSPMIGTFYRKPSPDKDAFVNIGDNISVGDVICVVEAMKLFNEIEAEISGKIVKVLVDDNSPIEYDQPLFLVEPA